MTDKKDNGHSTNPETGNFCFVFLGGVIVYAVNEISTE